MWRRFTLVVLLCLVRPSGGWGASPSDEGEGQSPDLNSETEQKQDQKPAPDTPTLDANPAEPFFEVKGRIHVRWEMTHSREGVTAQESAVENSFLIRRARLKFIWRPTPWVMGVVQVGAEREFELGSALLNDAYIHISPLPYLELRVGQFKKPFSGLEQRSSGKLKVLERGLGNEHIVEDLLYGGRDLGFQLSGRMIPALKLDYAVGVFNGSGPHLADQGNSKDVAARLTMRPHKRLRLGASGSVKFFDEEDNPAGTGWAASADVDFRFKGFRLFVEGLVALDHLYWTRLNPVDSAPLVLNGIGILSYRYRFPVSVEFRVEPIFKFEVLDPNSEIVEDEVFVYGPGFNAYFGEYLRLMVHAEVRRSERNGREEYPAEEVLMVQFCFDI